MTVPVFAFNPAMTAAAYVSVKQAQMTQMQMAEQSEALVAQLEQLRAEVHTLRVTQEEAASAERNRIDAERLEDAARRLGEQRRERRARLHDVWRLELTSRGMSPLQAHLESERIGASFDDLCHASDALPSLQNRWATLVEVTDSLPSRLQSQRNQEIRRDTLILEATDDSYDEDVLRRSAIGPVLVVFYDSRSDKSRNYKGKSVKWREVLDTAEAVTRRGAGRWKLVKVDLARCVQLRTSQGHDSSCAISLYAGGRGVEGGFDGRREDSFNQFLRACIPDAEAQSGTWASIRPNQVDKSASASFVVQQSLVANELKDLYPEVLRHLDRIGEALSDPDQAQLLRTEVSTTDQGFLQLKQEIDRYYASLLTGATQELLAMGETERAGEFMNELAQIDPTAARSLTGEPQNEPGSKMPHE